jgi:hypothetical protein
MIKEGEPIRDIAIAFPSQYIRYSKGIEKLAALTRIVHRDPNVDPIVHWWYGPTGVGKSRKAYETWPTAYRKMNGNHWWDHYAGEKTVVIDDYRASMVPFNLLLNYLDRYPMTVEVKGHSCPLSANVFVITTPKRPEVTWHKQTDEALNQLIRRCTHIVRFDPDGTEHVEKSPDVAYQMLSKAEVDALIEPPIIFN